MSEQDNVRAVQSIYEAFGRGDVEAIVGVLADRFEWHHQGAPAVPWAKASTFNGGRDAGYRCSEDTETVGSAFRYDTKESGPQ